MGGLNSINPSLGVPSSKIASPVSPQAPENPKATKPLGRDTAEISASWGVGGKGSASTIRREENATYFSPQEAKAAIDSIKASEEKALSGLNSEQQQQYRQIKALLEGDPLAQLSLQKLLMEKKLPGAPDLRGEKDLLSRLSDLADPNKQKLDEFFEYVHSKGGDSRNALVSDLVKEIADPTSISQKSSPSCSVTVAQIMLAKNDPAEYVRLISGLVSPDQKVTLASGQTLKANGLGEDIAKRTIPSFVLQEALLGYGTDRQAGGLNSEEAAKTYSDLFNGNYTSLRPTADLSELKGKANIAAAKDEIFDVLEKSLKEGKPLPVALQWTISNEDKYYINLGGGDHMVLPTKIEEGRVFFDNPWGEKDSMSVEDFKRRLESVFIEK